MFDMRHLDKFHGLEVHASAAMKAFLAFDKTAWSDGAIPRKYKELIAVAVALTVQCPYCIELHVERARKHDASDPELAETVFAAGALRAGGAITHGTHAMHESGV